MHTKLKLNLNLNLNLNLISRFAMIGLVAGQAAPAMADPSGGTITFAVTSSIPTLSEWALVLMSFILAVMAYRVLRNSKQGQPLASLAALGILGLAALVTHGPNWDARATLYSPVTVEAADANAGLLFMPLNTIYEMTNNSGRTLQITGVNPETGITVGDLAQFYPALVPICTNGFSLAAGAKCYVWWLSPA